MSRRGRRLVVLATVAWAVLFWFCVLLFGTWSALDLMASAAIGLAAAASVVATAELAPQRSVMRLRWLRLAASVPQRTVLDFGILICELVRALATGAPRAGVFRAKPYDAGAPTGPVSSGWRAYVGAVAGFSPNAYVVEIDPGRQEILVHDLVPNDRSEAPA